MILRLEYPAGNSKPHKLQQDICVSSHKDPFGQARQAWPSGYRAD